MTTHTVFWFTSVSQLYAGIWPKIYQIAAILDVSKLGNYQMTLHIIGNDSRKGHPHNDFLIHPNMSFRSWDMGQNGKKYIKWQPSSIYAN